MLFRFFSRLYFGKILSNGTRPCPIKATSFQIKTPHPRKRFRTWKQKKTNLLKVILKYSGGIYSILNTFQNTKRQKYRINGICWKKTTFDVLVTGCGHFLAESGSLLEKMIVFPLRQKQESPTKMRNVFFFIYRYRDIGVFSLDAPALIFFFRL